jgi:hypothetical protein
MSYVLWTLACLCVYVSGLVILMIVTPLLLSRDYDEGFFMAIAAADVFGGMFVFGSVAIIFALYSGVFAARLLDFFLLLGIVIVAFSLSYRCSRSQKAVQAHPVSRFVASGYCLFLGLAALFYLGLLFMPGG